MFNVVIMSDQLSTGVEAFHSPHYSVPCGSNPPEHRPGTA